MAAAPTGPLAGVRILDLSQVVAGPYGTQILADQGADVIRVDLVGGSDPFRMLGFPLAPGLTEAYMNVNRNKRSIRVDAKKPEGLALLLRLAAKCDVVYQNFRPGAVDRMGIGYEACRKVNPDIIYLSSSGYGTTGPYADDPVYDPLIQAVGGSLDAQRDYATDTPRFVQTLIADKVSAMTNAQAVTAALFARRAGRGGTHIQTSMLDSFVAFQFPDMMLNLTSMRPDFKPGPEAGRLLRPYKTRDGAIAMMPLVDKGFAGFCRATGRGDIHGDPRFATLQLRYQNFAAVNAAIERTTQEYTAADLLRRLRAADVPASVINTARSLVDDPHIRATGAIAVAQHPAAGPIRLAPHSARFAGMPVQPQRRHAPSAGEHTVEVLKELLGLRDGEVAALHAGGVIAAPGAPGAKL